MRINNDQLSSSVGVVFGSLIVLHSFSYQIGTFSSPNTGFFPLLEGLVIILLSVIGLIISTLSERKGTGWEPLFRERRWERPLCILLSLFAYAFVVRYMGFTITTFVFLSFVFRIVEQIRWTVVVLASAAIALVSHFVFVILLQAQLPRGLVGF